MKEQLSEIMKELEAMGSESIRKTLLRHGAKEPLFGVKVGDMKTIVKRVKKDYQLAKLLFNTGNSDAMYLAGLIGDETKMTPDELHHWAEKSNWSMISEYTVPFVAAESPYGWDLALQWISSDQPHIASSGWATLSSIVKITPDDQLDQPRLQALMKQAAKQIHQMPERVAYTMNGFIIACGSYVKNLTPLAKQLATAMGPVTIDLGDTACKLPDILTLIQKVEAAGRVGKKSKTARC